ncbi:MAG: hypothetical protein CSA62_06900 [Planctomycetota bacterium]|nr:MAG: hypothetical protein CSA62_06900 [Planctomycetota bacterium]
MRLLTEIHEGERCQLHLCRHGEVDPAWHGRVYGGKDVPLAPEGEQRFVELAERMRGQRFAMVMSSDLSRAVHGATQVAKALDLPQRQDPRLREIDRGAWVGRTVQELRAECPEELEAYEADPFTWAGHGGESLNDLQARVWPVLAELAEEFPREEVFVVCHGQVIRSVVCKLLGIASPLAMRLGFSHGGISSLERLADGEWIVQRVNASRL